MTGTFEGCSRRENLIDSKPVQPKATVQSKQSFKHACLCARIASDYRGQDTIVLDLTGITPVFDYFVVTTGNSPRQMRAIAEEVERALVREGSKKLSVEGWESSTWILQDYGDIVLHLFTPETRRTYDLEHLWADAPRVDWQSFAEKTAGDTEQHRAAL